MDKLQKIKYMTDLAIALNKMPDILEKYSVTSEIFEHCDLINYPIANDIRQLADETTKMSDCLKNMTTIMQKIIITEGMTKM